MTAFVEELYENLDDDLRYIETEQATPQERNLNAVLKAEAAITTLKEKMKDYQFENDTEEIYFFRNSLPLFYSRLIFHLRLYNLETNRQGTSRKLCKKLFQHELKDIDLFFKKQITFRQYYHSGNTLLDKELFTKHHDHVQLPFLLTDYSFVLDPDFCTTYSLILSQMLAFEKLQEYIFVELKKLDSIQLPDAPESITPKKWQLGSFALIELGYLLHLTGAIHGNLKDTMNFLEDCFETKLGNYSRTFQKMRIRKGDRAAFLVKGIDTVYRHMDSLDDE